MHVIHVMHVMRCVRSEALEYKLRVNIRGGLFTRTVVVITAADSTGESYGVGLPFTRTVISFSNTCLFRQGHFRHVK